MINFSVRTLGVVALGIATAACNTFTGAGDLDVDPLPTVTGPDNEWPGGLGPSGNPLVLADGVEVTGLALYQALKIPLMEDGQPVTSDIPIVAGRDALLRVFYRRVDDAAEPKNVTVRLIMESPDFMPPSDAPDMEQEPLDISAPLGPMSTESELGSTLNVTIPASRMLPNTEFRVALLDDWELDAPDNPTGENTSAAYPPDPDDTPASLDVQTVGPMHLRLVPIRYNADGSGRLPDTSDEQLERYKTAFEDMYPVPEVIITVDPPWDSDIPAQTSSGFGQLLNALQAYRQDANAQPYEYFYGIVDPGGTDGIAGLASLGFSSDSRVGVGLGTTGRGSVNTAIHEVGHEHTRPHSPGCGAQNADPEWPRMEDEATLGTWGYERSTETLHDPAGEHRDFMSYCGPEWVSDFVYQRLFDVSKMTNPDPLTMAKQVLPERNKRYARLMVHPDGTATWLSDLVLRYEAVGLEDVDVDVTVDGETLARRGTFYPYDHLPGGVLLIPVELDRVVTDAAFAFHGQTLQASR